MPETPETRVPVEPQRTQTRINVRMRGMHVNRPQKHAQILSLRIYGTGHNVEATQNIEKYTFLSGKVIAWVRTK